MKGKNLTGVTQEDRELKIQCPQCNGISAKDKRHICLLCNCTGQINPEISAEEIRREINNFVEKRFVFQKKFPYSLTKECEKNYDKIKNQKFIPSSAVQEIIENNISKLKQHIDMHKDDYDNGLKEFLEDKDKQIEGLTRQLLQSRKEINEMKQEKKKLLDEVEKIIDKWIKKPCSHVYDFVSAKCHVCLEDLKQQLKRLG